MDGSTILEFPSGRCILLLCQVVQEVTSDLFTMETPGNYLKCSGNNDLDFPSGSDRPAVARTKSN